MNFTELYQKIRSIEEAGPAMMDPNAMMQQQMGAMQAKMPNLDPATMMKNQQARMAQMQQKNKAAGPGEYKVNGKVVDKATYDTFMAQHPELSQLTPGQMPAMPKMPAMPQIGQQAASTTGGGATTRKSTASAPAPAADDTDWEESTDNTSNKRLPPVPMPVPPSNPNNRQKPVPMPVPPDNPYNRQKPVPMPRMPAGAVEECGSMGPTGMMGMRDQQPDNVSMNLSMNGQGPGGIRDLLSILRDIQGAPADEPSMGPKSSGDLELDIKSMSHPHDEPSHDHEEDGLIFGNDMEEEYANQPDEMYSTIDDITNIGSNAGRGDNERPKVNGGGNPYTATSEGIKRQLQNLYQEVKSR